MQRTTIRSLHSASKRRQLDKLLWQVLWRPIGLPRNVQGPFAMHADKIGLESILYEG